MTPIYQKAQESPQSAIEDKIRSASPADQQDPMKPSMDGNAIEDALENEWAMRDMFRNAQIMTNETFALVLRRIGDKNVLPHVHVMLAFISSLASSQYLSDLIADTPWAELVALLNALVKTENQIQNQSQTQPTKMYALLASNMFPREGERCDELPLPEDYFIQGLIWADDYFPKMWFEREHEEEERYLELASTVPDRMKRVLSLGYGISMASISPAVALSFL